MEDNQINAVNTAGDTPLHIIAASGFLDGLKLLVSEGANVNMRNAAGQSPLHLVCAVTSTPDVAKAESIAILLSNGSEPNMQDDAGNAPLHFAVQTNCLEGIFKLLENGASAQLENFQGNSPLHVAASAGYFEAMQLLILTRVSDKRTTASIGEVKTFMAPELATEELNENLTDEPSKIAGNVMSGNIVEDSTSSQAANAFEEELNSRAICSPTSRDEGINDTDSEGHNSLWEECFTEDGHRYFYNITSGSSVWQRPVNNAVSSIEDAAEGAPFSNEEVQRSLANHLPQLDQLACSKEPSGNVLDETELQSVMPEPLDVISPLPLPPKHTADFFSKSSYEGTTQSANDLHFGLHISEKVVSAEGKHVFEVQETIRKGRQPKLSHLERSPATGLEEHVSVENSIAEVEKKSEEARSSPLEETFQEQTRLKAEDRVQQAQKAQDIEQELVVEKKQSQVDTASRHLAVWEKFFENAVLAHSQPQRGGTAFNEGWVWNDVQTSSEKFWPAPNSNAYKEEVQKMEKGMGLLYAAATGQDRDVLDLLIAGSFPEMRDAYDRQPLHHAAALDRGHVVRVLVNHGANVDSRDTNGLTSLHVAAWRGAESATKALLESAADPSLTTRTGDTPLHFAVKFGRRKIVRMLLRYGAKAEVSNAQGVLPIDLLPQRRSMREVENACIEITNMLTDALAGIPPSEESVADEDESMKQTEGQRSGEGSLWGSIFNVTSSILSPFSSDGQTPLSGYARSLGPSECSDGPVASSPPPTDDELTFSGMGFENVSIDDVTSVDSVRSRYVDVFESWQREGQR